MLIKDLIKQLQEIIDNTTQEEIDVMGEPYIYIDVFSKVKGFDHFQYCGISKDISIERTQDGVNLVLSAFVNSNNRQK